MPHEFHPTPLILHLPDDFVKNRPDLRRAGQHLAQKYAFGESVSEAELEKLGRDLWQALDADEVFDRARKEAGNAILPVLIESGDPEVQLLPWETLHHPKHGFLGVNNGFTLTRRFGGENGAPAALQKGPLRVLLFTSLPDDVNPETGRLQVEEEQARVQEALMPLITEGGVVLRMPEDGRFSTLKDDLETFQPHLLYLSGHGTFVHAPHTGDPPYGVFYFETDSGGRDPVKEADLAQAFYGGGVQCVVLSACESGKSASDALNRGLAQRLSEQGLAHVVGMRESLYDVAGISFATAFCEALARQERIDFALQAGRRAILKPAPEKGQLKSAPAGREEYGSPQWPLPMLVSARLERPLIDWNFPPEQKEIGKRGGTLRKIPQAPLFIGRRAELRAYKKRILDGELRKLLISGAGGQGKTMLAGKLARDLGEVGYRLFAWSARPENPWRKFQTELELALVEGFAKEYDRWQPKLETETERAQKALELLLEQFGGRVALFLDNLETLQNPVTLALEDAPFAAWLRAALNIPELVVLATSRWRPPEWEGEALPLGGASYGDFLQMVQQMANRGGLPGAFLAERARLGELYEALHGNGRGLEIHAPRLREVSVEEYGTFLDKLAQTKAELQINMGIEDTYRHLPEEARQLLRRLPVFRAPVPLEGVIKLGQDLAEAPETLLARLLDVSLVEVRYEARWDVVQYGCLAEAADWLRENSLLDEDPRWPELNADYQDYLFRYERRVLSQALEVHEALRKAGKKGDTDRFALDFIIVRYMLDGRYHTLLEKWFPDLCLSPEIAVRGEVFNQLGRVLLRLGDTETALVYLKDSLAIRQQIGDKAGEGDALNNISQIFKARGDYETALAYLKRSLAICEQIGDKAGEGTTLNNISGLYHAQGDYETALAYLIDALAICQQIGDKTGEGATLNNISAIYHAQGDYETALAYLKGSLAIRQQIGDKAGEGTVLNNISAIYHAQGDTDSALGYLKDALAIRQQIGDKAGEGTTLNNISQIYDTQGDTETALAYLKGSLDIRQQIGDKAGEGVTLNNISAIYHAQGDYETALAYLKRSLAICEQIGDKAGEGTTLNNISGLYHAQGDYETALSYLKGSLAIRKQIGDKAGLCATLFNIGHIHAQNNEIEEAFGAWVNAYVLAKEMGLAQALQALAELAPHLDMPAGLEGWEALAQRLQNPPTG